MSRNIVITGANRGIGLALTQYYLALGDSVYAACRNSSDALTASGATVLTGVDVATQNGIDNLKSALSDIAIDILINNAGIFGGDSIDELNNDVIEQQFRINALAPLKVTGALRNQLASRAKIALVTSRMGSMSDNSSGGYYGYRMSKAALNAAGVSLARDLANDKIAVAILHPGFVQTDMVGGMGDITPKQAAEGLAARIEELTLETSGGFWHSNGEALPW